MSRTLGVSYLYFSGYVWPYAMGSTIPVTRIVTTNAKKSFSRMILLDKEIE